MKPTVCFIFTLAALAATSSGASAQSSTGSALSAMGSATLVTGSVDRLVLVHHAQNLVAADVIDFKTDRVESDDPTSLRDRVEYSRPQIDAYCQAMSQHLRLDRRRVTARLVFVGAGLVFAGISDTCGMGMVLARMPWNR